jgi:transcriptional regulator with XRE-family HTH domain
VRTVKGNEFRKWRRSQDITQEQVAKNIVTDKSTISRWEHDLINISDTLYNKLMDFVKEKSK